MYLGVDIGSLAAKAVVVDDAGGVAASLIVPSGHDHRRTAEELAVAVCARAGLEPGDLAGAVGTGYGRASVPFVSGTVTEITCHARGAAHLLPGTRLVVDIGGQDSKVIRLDEEGRVADFQMNDRCAAGTGRFLEVMAGCLGLTLEALGEAAVASTSPARISSVCTVFAESEVVGLIAAGGDRGDIAAGLCRSIAERIAGMVGRVGMAAPVAMTGGVALNRGVLAAIGEKLGAGVAVPPEPQLAGALGAALLARDGAGRRG